MNKINSYVLDETYYLKTTSKIQVSLNNDVIISEISQSQKTNVL